MTKSRNILDPSLIPNQTFSVESDAPSSQQFHPRATGEVYSPFRQGLGSTSQNPSSTEHWTQEAQSYQPTLSTNAHHESQNAAPNAGHAAEETLRLTAFQGDWKKDALYRRSARYYGPTSFSAVFAEHQANLNEDLLDLGEDGRKHPATWPLYVEPHTKPTLFSEFKSCLYSPDKGFPNRATSLKLYNSCDSSFRGFFFFF
jgi:hypothetical protein